MKHIMITILVAILFTPVFAQDDTTSPSMTYFSFTPDTVDVTDGPAVVSLTLGAIDDLSGIQYGQASFYSPSGEQNYWPYFGFVGSMADTITTQMEIEQFSESGLWSIYYISLYDEVGNGQLYYASDLDSMGIQTSLLVNYNDDPYLAEAIILDVEDIPNDQGGRVYITFKRSLFDTDGLGRTEMYTVERLDGDQWVGLNSIGAYDSDVYVVEATTLADSTGDNDAVMTYRIIANMDEGSFESDPASGYSVDNIAPGLVAGLEANVSDGVVHLSWTVSEANDLSHYVVYRGNSLDFTADEGSMIGETTDPGFADDVTELGDYYYVVTVVDIHENESDPSDAVNVTLLSLVDVHGLPEEYALHQNYPNPFNPTTTLRYDLPEDATVSVVIYDMMGRQVRTLVSGQASAGYHSTMWNATNDLGSSISAGVYIYTIQAGEFRQTKKMVLLK